MNYYAKEIAAVEGQMEDGATPLEKLKALALLDMFRRSAKILRAIDEGAGLFSAGRQGSSLSAYLWDEGKKSPHLRDAVTEEVARRLETEFNYKFPQATP